MCDPVSLGIATAAMAATQSVASYVGMQQAYSANVEAANLGYANTQNSLMQENRQAGDKFSQQSLDSAIAAAKSQGQIANVESIQGGASSSVIQNINASMFGIGRQTAAEGANYADTREQIMQGNVDSQLKRESQINSVPQANPVSLILGLGSAAASGASTYQKQVQMGGGS